MYAVDSYSSDFLVIHSILLLPVKMTKINSNYSTVSAYNLLGPQIKKDYKLLIKSMSFSLKL